MIVLYCCFHSGLFACSTITIKSKVYETARLAWRSFSAVAAVLIATIRIGKSEYYDLKWYIASLRFPTEVFIGLDD